MPEKYFGTPIQKHTWLGRQLGKTKTGKRLDAMGDVVQRAAERSPDKAIRQGIEDLPEYEISPEAIQRMQLLEETGAGMIESAEEATDVAKMRAGMVEAPGTGQARRGIESATSRQIQAIQNIGGAGALGAAAQVGLGEERAYEDLIKSNLAYKEQSESDLMRTLQTEAGIRTQAAGLKGQALEGMASEREKVYQSQLAKAQTGLQFDVTNLATQLQYKTAQEQNKGLIQKIFT